MQAVRGGVEGLPAVEGDGEVVRHGVGVVDVRVRHHPQLQRHFDLIQQGSGLGLLC